MESILNKSIGQIVAEDFRTAEVFKKYNIDFCCNGGRSLQDISEDPEISMKDLIDDLNTSTNEINNSAEDYKSWPIDVLADHIEKKHHLYVSQKIPVIEEYLDKISRVHGDSHPELSTIKELFHASAGDLTAHMKKEEFILFPFIRKMVKSGKHGFNLDQPYFGSVQNPINKMHDEHDAEGARFEEIARLSNNFTVPEDGCNTYRVAYSLLKEFQDDLHLHVHLENNILFPKAIELEKELLN